jgi:hypothetical protein
MQFLCQRTRFIVTHPSHHQEAYFAPSLRQISRNWRYRFEKMAKPKQSILVQYCAKMVHIF